MRNRLKQILSLTLVFVLTLALMPVMTVPAYAASVTPSGIGTESDPYLIAEQGNLEWLAANLSSSAGKFYRQTADIALTGNWVVKPDAFSGVYDGYGHTISGINITAGSSYYFGLFHTIASGAIVRNLNLSGRVNWSTTSSTASSDYVHAGLLTGSAKGGSLIDNVTVMNQQDNYLTYVYQNTSSTGAANMYAGGIAGKNEGTIQNCSVKGGRVYAYLKQANNGICRVYLGGIAGYVLNGTIENCVVYDGVELNAYAYNGYTNNVRASIAGGIAGYCSDANLYNNFSGVSSWTLATTAAAFGGTIAGFLYSGTLDYNVAPSGKYYNQSSGAAGWTPGTSTVSNFSSATGETAQANLAEGITQLSLANAQSWFVDSDINAGNPYLKMGGIVTYDKQGGEGETPDVFIAGGRKAIEPAIPTREGYTFGGWYKEADCINVWSFADDMVTADTTLYARWTLITKITEVNDTTTDSAFSVVKQSNLDEVFDHVVTSADVTGDNIVTLSLNVSDIAEQNTDTEAIKAIANNTGEVYFFDVTLKKTVDNSGSITDTVLTNVPVPVEVHIKLTGELADRTYYRVYRYHNGAAEQISSDTSKAEHYTVNVANSEIIIRTMKFSTYAIFGNDAPIDMDTGYDVDVQAKITGQGGAKYKIDLAWGAMTFEYSTSGEWDADTHSYVIGGEQTGWLVEGFDMVNNKITAYNHSNGDVSVDFAITPSGLDGVTMKVNKTNSFNGEEAVNILLVRVPNVGGEAQSIEAFLRLEGKPTDPSRLNAAYQKIAVITATIKPAGGDLTLK